MGQAVVGRKSTPLRPPFGRASVPFHFFLLSPQNLMILRGPRSLTNSLQTCKGLLVAKSVENVYDIKEYDTLRLLPDIAVEPRLPKEEQT